MVKVEVEGGVGGEGGEEGGEGTGYLLRGRIFDCFGLLSTLFHIVLNDVIQVVFQRQYFDLSTS